MANKSTAELALTFGRLFNEMKYFLRRNMQEKLIGYESDISFELLEVIAFLWHKDGINQQELADMAVKDKSSMTYLIGKLLNRGLVRRVEDQTDRRNKLIFLTPKGGLLQKRLYPCIIELYQKASAGINDTEIKNGIELLKKMNENLKQSEHL